MESTQTKEIWKDIHGFEGEYQISSYGRVRSLPRVIERRNGRTQTIKGQVLRSFISAHDNTDRVALCREGRQFWYRVHRLVADAFVPNPDSYVDLIHLDNNMRNNRANNLKWCPRLERIEAYNTMREKHGLKRS